MKPEKHQDITEQMAERLREQRLPYREGAWEGFEALIAKRSKRAVLWPYFSGAAAVLIVAMMFLLRNDRQQAESTAVAKLPHQEKNIIVGKDTVELAIPLTPSADSGMEKHGSANIQGTVLVIDDEENHIDGGIRNENTEQPVIDQKNGLAVQPPLQPEDRKTREEKVETTVPPSPASPKEEMQVAQQTNPLLDQGNEIEARVNKKWNIGIEVSPTFSNDQVNLGGGVALAYSLSSKLSISSGISYVQLDAQRGPSMGGAMQSAPSSINIDRPTNLKSLNSIHSHLVGLDIPVNLNYHLNKRIYVSAGVSLFNVLQEDRVNEFRNEIAETAYSSSGMKNPEPVIRTLYSEEVVEDKPYEKDSYAGFLNFSVGYAIPLSKTIGFSVAPFFKLPVGNLTEQDMDLTNGGVKVIASF